MAAVPQFGRAARVEPPASPGADATRELFERFGSQIYGYCLHQLGSREEAEDAVQTTFMNVFRGLQRGIVPRVEGAWLFKIAQNVCLSRRRSKRRRGRVEAPNNFEVLQDVVPALERSTDELLRLHDALHGMPETQRQAILLREWQGLSYREIAERMGVSQAAVETLIFRARRSLAAGLEEPDTHAWRKRARHSVDAGGLLAALKSIFATGTSLKVAATVAAVATAVAVEDASHQRPVTHRRPVGAPVVTMPATHARVMQHVPRHAARAATPTRALRVSSSPSRWSEFGTPSHAKPRASQPAAAERPSSGVHASSAPPHSEPRGLSAPPRSIATPEMASQTPTAPHTPPKAHPAKSTDESADRPIERTPPPTREQPAPPTEQPAAQAAIERSNQAVSGQQDTPSKPDDPGGRG